MDHANARDQFARLKRAHAEYSVFDAGYTRLGKVDEIFVVEDDRLAYIGISRDMFGASLAPIPVEIVQVNDRRGVVVIDDSREHLESAPVIKNEDEISPELETRVRAYFGLEHEPEPDLRRELPRETAIAGGPLPDERVDTEPGERTETEETDLARDRARSPLGERGPGGLSRVRRLKP